MPHSEMGKDLLAYVFERTSIICKYGKCAIQLREVYFSLESVKPSLERMPKLARLLLYRTATPRAAGRVEPKQRRKSMLTFSWNTGWAYESRNPGAFSQAQGSNGSHFLETECVGNGAGRRVNP